MKSLTESKACYQRSRAVLAGPSTFSKGPDQFAYGLTPYAVARSAGAYFWDIDGHRYLDLMMALGAAILGYSHPYVNEAISRQLKSGISYTLTHPLEVEVAEMLCERIPCAELVRFGKNGNDVTSAAVRLSRHVTQKNHILFCGYHGWQDWYAGQTSINGGILEEIRHYSHRFKYNDLQDLNRLLEKHRNQTACIIMEPVGRILPSENYLQEVKKLAQQHGVVLIFDEIITGFRCHRGGYQALSGVVPDLACFSKALGNGMPISALVGKADIMRHCEDIYFSLTFAGESLSLAAAKAVMEIIDTEDVCQAIISNGQGVMDGIRELIAIHGLDEQIRLEGFPWRHVLIYGASGETPAADIRTYVIQELTKHWILSAGTQFVTLAHTPEDIQIVLSAYDAIFKSLKTHLGTGMLSKKLECPSARLSARDL